METLKEIKKIVKFDLIGGKATMTPPLGPTLIQLGLKGIDFCNRYNSLTKDKLNENIPVKVIIYEDNSYILEFLPPKTSKLILKFLGLKKASKNPLKEIGQISDEILEAIYEIKKLEFNTSDKYKILKSILGTAKQMGINYSKGSKH